MRSELAIGGVLVPALLLLAAVALALTAAFVRVLRLSSFYRLVAWRALVDVALFTLILAALVRLTVTTGAQP